MSAKDKFTVKLQRANLTKIVFCSDSFHVYLPECCLQLILISDFCLLPNLILLVNYWAIQCFYFDYGQLFAKSAKIQFYRRHYDSGASEKLSLIHI